MIVLHLLIRLRKITKYKCYLCSKGSYTWTNTQDQYLIYVLRLNKISLFGCIFPESANRCLRFVPLDTLCEWPQYILQQSNIPVIEFKKCTCYYEYHLETFFFYHPVKYYNYWLSLNHVGMLRPTNRFTYRAYTYIDRYIFRGDYS